MAGYKAKNGNQIGMVGGILRYVEFRAEADIDLRAPSAEKLPLYN
jgi:hypothetical protein